MSKALLAAGILVSALAWTQSVQRSDIVPRRYIVQFKNSSDLADDQKAVRAEIEKHGGRIIDTLTGPMKAMIVEADENTMGRVKKMTGVGLVKADRTIPLKPLPRHTETK